jgi:hypothetical protein
MSSSRAKTIWRCLALLANVVGTVLLYCSISFGSPLPVSLGSVPCRNRAAGPDCDPSPRSRSLGPRFLLVGFGIGLLTELLESCDR